MAMFLHVDFVTHNSLIIEMLFFVILSQTKPMFAYFILFLQIAVSDLLGH